MARQLKRVQKLIRKVPQKACSVCHGTGRIRDCNYPQVGPDGRLHRPVTTSSCHHCR